MAVARAPAATRPAGAPSHNLPSRLTSFVGREREIAEVETLVLAKRLVSLVGAPGVGKTRLGLQIAAGLQDRFPEGVWLVELAPLADPELVPHAVAEVLGVREQPGHSLAVTLAGYLRTRRLLLVLDNCEHLVRAAATLAEMLLQSCPSLHVLTTSREPLAIEGETTYRVPSLSVPDVRLPSGSPSSAPGGEEQGGGGTAGVDGRDDLPEAVRLFVDRARAASPSFAFTDRTAPLVGQICARLDGIPLAIELAAARVRALSLEQIAARLDDRFGLLTDGSRTALPRQRTLRGAVDWSYDLLSRPEQALLRRLAVFAGGFTLEAVDGVAPGEGRGAGGKPDHSSLAPRPSLLDDLVSLVDKSLVLVDRDADGEPRYRLLETIRQYGLEKLAEHRELAAVRCLHRDYFLALAEQVEPRLTGAAQIAALGRLQREHGNLRAALSWCAEEAGAVDGAQGAGRPDGPPYDADLGVRLAAALFMFWWLGGQPSEGARWLDLMLAAPLPDGSPARHDARARALHASAQLAGNLGEFRLAAERMEQALEHWRAIGDQRGVSRALQRLGFYLGHLGECDRARRLCEESVRLARRTGDPATLAAALVGSAHVAWFEHRYEQNAAYSEEALCLLRGVGNLVVGGFMLRSLSRAAYGLGDRDRALRLADEALSHSRELGDKRGIGESLKDQGYFALLDGDVDRAVSTLQASIRIYQELGDCWLTIVCLYGLAGAKVLEGTRSGRAAGAGSADARRFFRDAARLFATADALREQRGIAAPPDLRGTYERDLAILRAGLGEAECAGAWSEGRAMSFEQAVEYALALTTSSGRAAVGRQHEHGESLADVEIARLTPREREVALLVARGRTNRQIAESLVLSERTVDTHVHHILTRLELTSRAQIAAWVVEHRLANTR